jgi:pimeloyl-ACP methyl ester carboxylesterase
MRFLIALLLSLCAAPAAEATYDGSRVHYESYGAGPDALVFIHGWTCDLTFWRGQQPVYKERRSLLVDLPGHGRSDKPEVSYTEERFARAIEAVMRDAKVERAVLIGHSMGGPVAITFLQLFPEKTKALVLVDAFIPSPPKDDAARAKQKAAAAAFAQQFRESDYKQSAGKAIDSMFSDKTTPAQRDEIRSKMLSTPQQVMASAMENLFTLEPPKPGETYALPVLAIMAERSNRTGFEARLRTIFPNLTYEAWSGFGHFLMMESPDRFNRTLTDFLSQATGVSRSK